MLRSWNPIANIKRTWKATRGNFFGKFKVILFYIFVWMLILANAYSVITPMAVHWGCMEDDESPSSEASIELLVRQFSLMTLSFGLLIEQGGPTLPNLRFLLCIIFGSAVILHGASGKSIDDACLDPIRFYYGSSLMTVTVVMILAYIERHHFGTSSEESEPLLSHGSSC